MDPLISIIVPVYNVEAYLATCIDSIVHQNCNRIEVILVDDQSPDRCPEICDQYAAEYHYVTVIHQENRGLSGARNAGIEIAKGEFLMFVDSDDYIADDCLQKLVPLIEKNRDTDLILFPFINLFEDTGTEKLGGLSERLSPDQAYEISESLIYDILCIEQLWNVFKCIVRRQFINLYKHRFREKFLHEDLDWTSRLLLTLNRFYYSDYSWYYYRNARPGSIMRCLTLKNFNDTVQIVRDLIPLINQTYPNESDTKEKFFAKLGAACTGLLRIYNCVDSREKREFERLLIDNLDLLSYSDSIKHRCFYLIAKMTNMKLALKAYSLYKGSTLN